MAEEKALWKVVDEKGNVTVVYPITKQECVEGLPEALAGKAPGGYGYGGEIPDLITVSTDQELKSALDGLLSNMPNYSARNVRAAHNGAQVVNGAAGMGGQGTLYGSLYKHSDSYAVLRVHSYLGTTFSLVKLSTWGEVEWVNPPMDPGVEYRTTERWNGKPVYAALIECGVVPGGGIKSVSHGLTVDRVLRVCGSLSYFGITSPYMNTDSYSDGNPVFDISAHRASVFVKCAYASWANSGYTVTAQLWYTKP